MGRTQHTYRMRLQTIQDRLLKKIKESKFQQIYRDMWVSAHNFSGASSIFPHPDTTAVATFSMLLEGMKRIEELKLEIENLDGHV